MSDAARSRNVAFVLPLLLLSFGAAALAQPAFRVKDINTTRSDGIQYPLDPNDFLENLAAMGTAVFLGASDGIHGSELWRTDGTEAGTRLVKDLHPGPESSLPGEFTRAGGTVFFRSDAGGSPEKLWKTNGTRTGTQLLHAVEQFHNFGFFSPRNLTALGNKLVFLGSCCIDTPPEMMRSDGTVTGTGPLSTISGANASESIVSLGNQVLYQGGYDRAELWRSDGTSAGTIPLLGGVLSVERYLADVSAARDGVLLFASSKFGIGEELWQSDGTVAGTHLAAEIVPGAGSKRLGPFASTGPVVFFAAGGDELWKNDAGGTSLVRALPGNPNVGIRSLTALGGKVYFSYDDGAHGRELWVSDGTPDSTRLLADLQPGAGSSDPRHLHAEGSILLFAASDGVHGIEPWRTDGTAPGTRMIQDIARAFSPPARWSSPPRGPISTSSPTTGRPASSSGPSPGRPCDESPDLTLTAVEIPAARRRPQRKRQTSGPPWHTRIRASRAA